MAVEPPVWLLCRQATTQPDSQSSGGGDDDDDDDEASQSGRQAGDLR